MAFLSSEQGANLKGYPNLLVRTKFGPTVLRKRRNEPGFRLTNNQLPEHHSNPMGFVLAGSSKDLFHHFQSD